MRVLVVGAYGLIGSHVLVALRRAGHDVVAAGRRIDAARRAHPYARWVTADLARMRTAADWMPLLADVQAVVNCAGLLQDGPRDDLRSVQVDGTVALFHACAATGVRRLGHVSAAGVGPGAGTSPGSISSSRWRSPCWRCSGWRPGSSGWRAPTTRPPS